MRILRQLVLAIPVVRPSLRRWGLAAIVDEFAAAGELPLRNAGPVWRRVPRCDVSYRRLARLSDIGCLPDVVGELCTSTVMVQQFSRGILPPQSAACHGRGRCGSKLVDSYIVQIATAMASSMAIHPATSS